VSLLKRRTRNLLRLGNKRLIEIDGLDYYYHYY
jgi:hypothetical protein